MKLNLDYSTLMEKLQYKYTRRLFLINFLNGRAGTALTTRSTTGHTASHAAWHSTGHASRHTSWHAFSTTGSLVHLGDDRGADTFQLFLLVLVFLFLSELVGIEPLDNILTLLQDFLLVIF